MPTTVELDTLIDAPVETVARHVMTPRLLDFITRQHDTFVKKEQTLSIKVDQLSKIDNSMRQKKFGNVVFHHPPIEINHYIVHRWASCMVI